MLYDGSCSQMTKKSSKKQINKKNRSLAEIFIDQFKLVKDKEFIRFKEAPSHLTATITNAHKELSLKYGGSPIETVQLVHRVSFMRNPLRYIFQMIDQAEVSAKTKKIRVEKVNELIKEAMINDPHSTVKAIIYSLARVVRF